ncbi:MULTISPECIES: hypothetical protein [unclassified Clostridium]|uniref:hypothetical protein n=1 Tax=unclassified Clostridium TaxID=2614128 RepID=UPI000297662D|nr:MULTISPECIES: hypothetical protein [unclassified Clostridium]EKQ56412.1 MAG: hypothetical protein A370_02004 [Clostridium sp. Maddingley MBC34-26]
MFKEIKNLLNSQFNRMQNFDSENNSAKAAINKKNSDFSKDLNNKISSSQSRISEIRKSIQNTKL